MWFLKDFVSKSRTKNTPTLETGLRGGATATVVQQHSAAQRSAAQRSKAQHPSLRIVAWSIGGSCRGFVFSSQWVVGVEIERRAGLV